MMSARRWTGMRAATPAEPARLCNAGLWLLSGLFVTTVGNAMHTLAIGKVLFDRTGSVAAFGAVLILEQVLNIVVQFAAGAWVDQGDSRRTGLFAELFRGTVVCVASLMLAAFSGVLGWIVLMTMAIRLAQPFYRAATFALAPLVISTDRLSRFNGYHNLCLQGGQLVGVALTGPVLLYCGATGAFLLNGVSFLLSGAAIWMVSVPRDGAAVEAVIGEKGSASARMLAAWGEIGVMLRDRGGLRIHLLLSSADNVAVILFNLALVPLVVARFDGSPYWLSMVDGAFAVGAMAGIAAIEPLKRRFGSGGAVGAGLGGQGACFVLAGLADHAGPEIAGWLTLCLVGGIGAANTVSWTVITTTLQLRAAKAIRGRIATVRNLLTASVAAAVVPCFSALEKISLAPALIASGGVCFAYVAMLLVAGRTRRSGHVLGEAA